MKINDKYYSAIKKRTKWWFMQHELIFKLVCWKKEVRHKGAHYFTYQMQN